MSKAAQLAALETAINTGVTEVAYDGVTTKYRSLIEMQIIRDELRAELGQPVAKPQPYASSFAKGYR